MSWWIRYKNMAELNHTVFIINPPYSGGDLDLLACCAGQYKDRPSLLVCASPSHISRAGTASWSYGCKRQSNGLLVCSVVQTWWRMGIGMEEEATQSSLLYGGRRTSVRISWSRSGDSCLPPHSKLWRGPYLQVHPSALYLQGRRRWMAVVLCEQVSMNYIRSALV